MGAGVLGEGERLNGGRKVGGVRGRGSEGVRGRKEVCMPGRHCGREGRGARQGAWGDVRGSILADAVDPASRLVAHRVNSFTHTRTELPPGGSPGLIGALT